MTSELGRMERLIQDTGWNPNGPQILNRYIAKTRYYDWLQALGLHETGLFIHKTYARHIDLEV